MGFQAGGQRYAELQKDTTTQSLAETIAAGAKFDSLITEGSVNVSMT